MATVTDGFGDRRRILLIGAAVIAVTVGGLVRLDRRDRRPEPVG